MLFNSIDFAVFLPIVLLVFWWFEHRSHSYPEKFDQAQLALSHHIPRSIAARNPVVTYHDLMDDARFVLEDFCNTDHLCASGNHKLTRILAEDLGLLPVAEPVAP